jgi:hypothetical protein
MKVKNIAVIIGLVLGLAACKKAANYPIVGKWQQIKLRTYTQSYAGVITNDTTYEAPSFNATNYAQFNNYGTCIIGLFYKPGIYYLTSDFAYIPTQTYHYTRAGDKYVLTIPTTETNPGGFGTADTASVNGNTVLIHSVFDSHQDYAVSDAYYTK